MLHPGGLTPGVLSNHPGVLSYPPGVLSYAPGVEDKDDFYKEIQLTHVSYPPGVYSYPPEVLSYSPGVLSYTPGVVKLGLFNMFFISKRTNPYII